MSVEVIDLTEIRLACNALGANRVNTHIVHSLIFSTACVSQAKIALKGTSEEQLMELEAFARKLNLCAQSIEDQ
jgi:peptidyl-tRNA hydrolase